MEKYIIHITLLQKINLCVSSSIYWKYHNQILIQNYESVALCFHVYIVLFLYLSLLNLLSYDALQEIRAIILHFAKLV